MENKAEIKDRLKEAMALRDLKAVDLCNKTGIPKGAISYYMSGRSKPKSDRIYLLAKALNVSETWLLGYSVPMDRREEQKKNDKLAQLVAKLRSDSDFFLLVSELAELSAEQYKSIEGLLRAFIKK